MTLDCKGNIQEVWEWSKISTLNAPLKKKNDVFYWNLVVHTYNSMNKWMNTDEYWDIYNIVTMEFDSTKFYIYLSNHQVLVSALRFKVQRLLSGLTILYGFKQLYIERENPLYKGRGQFLCKQQPQRTRLQQQIQ